MTKSNCKMMQIYSCKPETFLKRINDLKKVILLKQQYEQIRNCPLEERLELIDRINAIFPSSTQFNKEYKLMLTKGANDQRLRDVYSEIKPIGALLEEFDNDTELHKLRYEITKNNLLDILHAIQTGYFVDGTRLEYETLNNVETRNFDLIEVCKRLTFAGNSKYAYFYSCCYVNPNINYYSRRIETKIYNFIANAFPGSDNREYGEIEGILRKFLFENGFNNLIYLSNKNIINKNNNRVITIYNSGMEPINITLTMNDYQIILAYMNKENIPYLNKIYEELLKHYAKIKYYTNGNEELINYILFHKTTIYFSLLERISILEYLLNNKIPITIENYTKFLENFIFEKECHIIDNPKEKYNNILLEKKRIPPKPLYNVYVD